MKALDFRTRIAILWALWAATATFSMLLGLLVQPDALEEVLAGEIEGFATDGWVGYYMAAFAIIPLAMSVMTMHFDNRAMRYGNLVVAAVIAAWSLVEMVGHLADSGFNASLVVSIATILVAFLIAAISVTALRRATPERTARTHEVIDPEQTTTV